jgi:hypothetical protein
MFKIATIVTEDDSIASRAKSTKKASTSSVPQKLRSQSELDLEQEGEIARKRETASTVLRKTSRRKACILLGSQKRPSPSQLDPEHDEGKTAPHVDIVEPELEARSALKRKASRKKSNPRYKPRNFLSKSSACEEGISKPNECDILLGRGRGYFDHVGNKRFREIVGRNLHLYQGAENRWEKTIVVESISREVFSTGARFLKQKDGNDSCLWYDVGIKGAKDKVRNLAQPGNSYPFRASHYSYFFVLFSKKIGHSIRDALADKSLCIKMFNALYDSIPGEKPRKRTKMSNETQLSRTHANMRTKHAIDTRTLSNDPELKDHEIKFEHMKNDDNNYLDSFTGTLSIEFDLDNSSSTHGQLLKDFQNHCDIITLPMDELSVDHQAPLDYEAFETAGTGEESKINNFNFHDLLRDLTGNNFVSRDLPSKEPEDPTRLPFATRDIPDHRDVLDHRDIVGAKETKEKHSTQLKTEIPEGKFVAKLAALEPLDMIFSDGFYEIVANLMPNDRGEKLTNQLSSSIDSFEEYLGVVNEMELDEMERCIQQAIQDTIL